MREPNTPEEIGEGGGGISSIWRRLGDHDARLGNGRERFAELMANDSLLREELKALNQKLAPRPVRWWVVIGGSFGAAVTILSVVWALATQITALDEGLKALTRTVEETRTDVRAIREKVIK